MNRYICVVLVTMLTSLSLLNAQQDTLIDLEETYYVVEEMPCFPGCEELKDKSEAKACADKKLLEYIYKNMRFDGTKEERDNECGTIIVKFVIDAQGNVCDVEVTCCKLMRENVENLFKSMPRWIPGRQRGKPVRVKHQFPLRIKWQ